ncbi:LOW QUALITY PROTEIN: hypothetical protein BU14_0093s0019, partial [Porphyra umbilicalis]
SLRPHRKMIAIRDAMAFVPERDDVRANVLFELWLVGTWIVLEYETRVELRSAPLLFRKWQSRVSRASRRRTRSSSCAVVSEYSDGSGPQPHNVGRQCNKPSRCQYNMVGFALRRLTRVAGSTWCAQHGVLVGETSVLNLNSVRVCVIAVAVSTPPSLNLLDGQPVSHHLVDVFHPLADHAIHVLVARAKQQPFEGAVDKERWRLTVQPARNDAFGHVAGSRLAVDDRARRCTVGACRQGCPCRCHSRRHRLCSLRCCCCCCRRRRGASLPPALPRRHGGRASTTPVGGHRGAAVGANRADGGRRCFRPLPTAAAVAPPPPTPRPARRLPPPCPPPNPCLHLPPPPAATPSQAQGPLTASTPPPPPAPCGPPRRWPTRAPRRALGAATPPRRRRTPLPRPPQRPPGRVASRSACGVLPPRARWMRRSPPPPLPASTRPRCGGARPTRVVTGGRPSADGGGGGGVPAAAAPTVMPADAGEASWVTPARRAVSAVSTVHARGSTAAAAAVASAAPPPVAAPAAAWPHAAAAAPPPPPLPSAAATAAATHVALRVDTLAPLAGTPRDLILRSAAAATIGLPARKASAARPVNTNCASSSAAIRPRRPPLTRRGADGRRRPATSVLRPFRGPPPPSPRRFTACSVISGPFIPQKGVQDNGGMQGKTSVPQAYCRSRLK